MDKIFKSIALILIVIILFFVLGAVLDFSKNKDSSNIKDVIDNFGAKIFGSVVDSIPVDYNKDDVVLFDEAYKKEYEWGMSNGHIEGCKLRHFKNATDPQFMWICVDGCACSKCKPAADSPNVDDNNAIGYTVVCKWNGKPVADSVLSYGKKLIITVGTKAYEVNIAYPASKKVKDQLDNLYIDFPIGSIVRPANLKFMGMKGWLFVKSKNTWYSFTSIDNDFLSHF